MHRQGIRVDNDVSGGALPTFHTPNIFQKDQGGCISPSIVRPLMITKGKCTGAAHLPLHRRRRILAIQ